MNENIKTEDELMLENAFRELNETLDMLNEINSTDFVLDEAVHDTQVGMKKRMNNAIANTADTTKMAGDIMGAAIDVKAAEYKAGVSIVAKISGLIAKAAYKLIELLDNSIKRLSKLSASIKEIPGTIITKVQGDINIYITAGDIATLYNESVIMKLDKAMAIIADLSKGDTWKASIIFKRPFISDDIKKAKNLHNILGNVEQIAVTPSKIDMKDSANIDMYLSVASKIEFTDLKGNRFSGNYYQALHQLLTDLNERNNTLEDLRKTFGEKYNASQANSNYANLSSSDQRIITEAVQDVSRAVSMTATIIKYVTADINTISKAATKITSYYNKSKSK